MAGPLQISFAPLSGPITGAAMVLAGDELALGPTARGLDERSKGALVKAMRAADFKGKMKTSVELLAPAGLDVQRLLVAGTAGAKTELDRLLLGGHALAQLGARKGDTATLIVDPADAGEAGAEVWAADLAFGALLRSYTFKKYVTRARDENGENDAARASLRKLIVHCAKPEAANKAFQARKAVAEGVFLARDLVNEPANVLGPEEFAERMRDLADAGLEVEILTPEDLKGLKMNALLAVGQGSARGSRVAVLQWNGAKGKRAKTLCFVGKGVCFDTGGISMKPAGGMEDMKGDMGGAACVAGLMLALARRKAPVNAVGLIGLTENMPSGTAQRPGDIVTSMSGQTIEVLNTDAEGRLVLADVLWYAQERFKPRLIIDLATLTGAIMVALGKEYAGLFSNDDRLAAELSAAGEATGEKVWRMPLAKAYDKMIDSKNADVKNIGGRNAGAITAAQFLQRFIRNTPWAHLDIAGTGMDTPRTEINQSWGGGWGVRLLDRLVADNYEKAEK
ncbi:MAG TPA: leucyl aminopeptidase [Hyphomicrobiaceae bacterium]|jgi:leucyl aminopeptidase|nr:leucyl aminopeptidase [Hyphomicrobiaceae bacterium]